MERFPCLATRHPAAAATNGAEGGHIEGSGTIPPVPQVSITEFSRRVTAEALLRMALANPMISSGVSPFMCRATSNADICESVALPSIRPMAAE